MASPLPALPAFLADRNLLIWGLGKEGLSTYRYLRRHFPDKILTVADDRIVALRGEAPFAADPRLRFVAGKGTPPLADFDLVVKSPGIPVSGLGLGALADRITGQADLFLRFAAGRTIGITGTKGKSTTSYLLTHLLREGGIASQVWLGGNFGIPLWDFIDDLGPASVTVAELSSYQLEQARHAPHIAVWLNLYEEHLNYHGSFAAYREAKANLVRHLKPGGHLILRADDPHIAEALRGMEIRAAYHPFTTDSVFPYSLEGNLQLPGRHNELNAWAALTAARLVGIDEAAVPAALKSFRSLPHRLEYLGVFGGVRYYNDSISTVPEATLAALQALPGTEVLILGGMDRGISYQGLAAALARPGLRHVLLLPETGALIGRLLEQPGLVDGPRAHPVETLEEAVRLAGELARPGGTCLFSPAASSYHRYRNFEERGDAFRLLVQALRT